MTYRIGTDQPNITKPVPSVSQADEAKIAAVVPAWMADNTFDMVKEHVVDVLETRCKNADRK